MIEALNVDEWMGSMGEVSIWFSGLNEVNQLITQKLHLRHCHCVLVECFTHRHTYYLDSLLVCFLDHLPTLLE